jgi:hypothetical protein
MRGMSKVGIETIGRGLLMKNVVDKRIVTFRKYCRRKRKHPIVHEGGKQ